ncbi:hypothetical protein [Cryptosporangium sp. NPDC051539]|uniref:hypothetical protein n=1 Tax=Cryptosporangium sp. NPDC051539 TaxID=3363962 RepID=UPI00379F6B67
MRGELLDDVVRPDGRHVSRKLALRRTAVAVLVGIVLLGAVGAFGVRSGFVRTTSNGYTLTLEYPRIARAGLDVPWRVTVSNPAGFSDDLELAVTAKYFEIFETQGFDPEPSAETADGTYRYLTFDRPPAREFHLSYDAYIQPSSQVGEVGELRLLEKGVPRATVRFHTWLLP